MHSCNWKEFLIAEEIIEQAEKLDRDEGWTIMGDRYPFFEWDLYIEINETMANDDE